MKLEPLHRFARSLQLLRTQCAGSLLDDQNLALLRADDRALDLQDPVEVVREADIDRRFAGRLRRQTFDLVGTEPHVVAAVGVLALIDFDDDQRLAVGHGLKALGAADGNYRAALDDRSEESLDEALAEATRRRDA